MENGNLDRLWGQIDRRLERIEEGMDKLIERNDDTSGRVSALEIKQAEQRGGYKVLAVIGAAAGTVGGIIATFFSYIIPPRY